MGTDHNGGGQGAEMADKGNNGGAEITALNMVMDLVVEHIVIDYLGCWHCLLVLFMDLSKR
jgi:hypothetical protein